ncbi:MAG: alpha/beta hydrolase [Anaeromyxobacter sp.]
MPPLRRADHALLPRAPEPSDLQGWSRLALDGVLGLTGVVEAMHETIARWPGFGPGPRSGRTRGLTGLVYSAVRGVTRATGLGVDLALAAAASGSTPAAGAEDVPASARRVAIQAVLNGVVGDHLAETGNPLAIAMRLRRDGRPLVLEREALAAALPDAGGAPLVLVHGSCFDDLRRLRAGHDHGAALARDLGFTPVYLHYNTGLHVSTNGGALSSLLDALVAAWPTPVTRLTLLAHSMGGLVVRSACAQAERAGHAWRGRLSDAVFLGTPHHGAPLERGGNLVDVALGVSRYSAPIARLGKIRSAGVTDLRQGSVSEEDWAGRDRFAWPQPPPRHVPLPAGVRCFAVAATTAAGDHAPGRLLGDGLVPLDSALGRHADPARDLRFPEERRAVVRSTGHVELLSSAEVYARLLAWLGEGRSQGAGGPG